MHNRGWGEGGGGGGSGGGGGGGGGWVGGRWVGGPDLSVRKNPFAKIRYAKSDVVTGGQDRKSVV